MTILDDVLIGKRAEYWCKRIGLYGDPLRMSLVNKLVASALNHFGGDGGRERIAKPHTLIQKALSELHQDVDKWSELGHMDKRGLTAKFPSLVGTSLLDLGSGSGHLGGWLSTLGVRYIGVEPSIDLHRAAQRDKRLAKTNLFQASIQSFCKTDSYSFGVAPTLISIIGVLDHLAAPEDGLNALFDFMARRQWANVPILLATFDPDFFLPGLPTCYFVRQIASHYGATETLGIRDPAAWEELFVNCGFHLLEQRPLHISSLPQELAMYLHDEHERIFAAAPSLRDGGEANMIVKARVPPRQGPFYFWLVCPRTASIRSQGDKARDVSATEPRRTESFAEDEVLSVVGNLGSRIYRLIEGDAYFASPETGSMPFEQSNRLFGQLETACNYVSSRILGTLVARAGSRLETTDSRQILDHLVTSRRFEDELFLSLLQHLSSVQFKPFVSAKRSDTSTPSHVLTGKSYNAQSVCNIAACLLQASANVVNTMPFTDYRSRILVNQGPEQMGEFIYGPKAKREVDRLLEILPELVQANVIDSFSAHSIEDSGAHQRLDDIEDGSANSDDEPSDGAANRLALIPLHIGWQAARFILHCFPMRDVDNPKGDLGKLALAISAFLGLNNDRAAFKSHWAILNQAERRNHKQARRTGRAPTSPMPRTGEDRCEHVLTLVQCSEEDRNRLRAFLNTLRSGFDYNENSDFSREHGLSRFIVVRDVWALVACLLNDGSMWNTAKHKIVKVNDYIKRPEQKPRIIAYVQECIAHSGRQSGLENCPW